MNGFVQQALTISKNLSQIVMKGLRPDALPVYTELVKEFAVFDRWFSSLPDPPHPNRIFVYSATSHGAMSHLPHEEKILDIEFQGTLNDQMKGRNPEADCEEAPGRGQTEEEVHMQKASSCPVS